MSAGPVDELVFDLFDVRVFANLAFPAVTLEDGIGFEALGDIGFGGVGEAPARRCYMHMNPLNRGLVTGPREWPWSRFLFYLRGEH